MNKVVLLIHTKLVGYKFLFINVVLGEKMKDYIYLDNSATTMVYQEVVDEMLPYFTDIYGNSSSLHTAGLNANKGVSQARKRIATALNADENEIYFTSGGTEANNWILKGIATGNKHKGKHIIVSEIEHHSIIDSAKYLIDCGFDVDFAPVDKNGVVDLDKLKSLVRKDTILVSIMAVNNEIGSIQPVKDIVNIVKSVNPNTYVHSDYVQAISVMSIDVKKLGLDALTISSHKIHGPKGVGALYVKRGVKVDKFIHGGEQERRMRGGTTNVPAIVGFGKAVELNSVNLKENINKLSQISNYFIEQVSSNIKYININSPNTRSPQIVNISFDLIEGESVLLWLNKNNIAVSTGSACASTSLDKSHVLTALGLPHQLVNGAVRFSFGTDIEKEDVDYVITKLKEIVDNLRKMSPLKEEDVCIMKK